MSEAEKLSLQISNLRKYRDGLVPYSSDGLRKAKQYVLNPVLLPEEDESPGFRRKRAKSEDSPSKADTSTQPRSHQTHITTPENFDRLTALTRILLETLEEQGALRAVLEHTVETEMPFSEKLNNLGLESRLQGTLAELEKTVQKLIQVRIDLDQERNRRITSERALQIAISDLEKTTNELDIARKELQDLRKVKKYPSKDINTQILGPNPPPPLSPPPYSEPEETKTAADFPKKETKIDQTLSSIVLDIDLGDGFKGSIDVTLESNPIELAYEFVYRHALNPDYVYPLIEYITKTKISLEEERQNHSSDSPVLKEMENLNLSSDPQIFLPKLKSPPKQKIEEDTETVGSSISVTTNGQSNQNGQILNEKTTIRNSLESFTSSQVLPNSPVESEASVIFQELNISEDPLSPLALDQSNLSPSQNGTFELSVTEENILPISNQTKSHPGSTTLQSEKSNPKYSAREQLNFSEEGPPVPNELPRNASMSYWQHESDGNPEDIADSDSEIASIDLQQLHEEDDSYLLQEEEEDQICDDPIHFEDPRKPTGHEKFSFANAIPDRNRLSHDSFEDDNYSAVDLEVSDDQGPYNPTRLLNQMRNSTKSASNTISFKTPSTQSSLPRKLTQGNEKLPTIANELSRRAENLDPLEVAIEVFDSATTLANEGNIDDAIPLYLHALKLFEEHDAEELPMIREEIWRWVSLADDAINRDQIRISSEASSQAKQLQHEPLRSSQFLPTNTQKAQLNDVDLPPKAQTAEVRPKQRRSIPNIDIL